MTAVDPAHTSSPLFEAAILKAADAPFSRQELFQDESTAKLALFSRPSTQSHAHSFQFAPAKRPTFNFRRGGNGISSSSSTIEGIPDITSSPQHTTSHGALHGDTAGPITQPDENTPRVSLNPKSKNCPVSLITVQRAGSTLQNLQPIPSLNKSLTATDEEVELDIADEDIISLLSENSEIQPEQTPKTQCGEGKAQTVVNRKTSEAVEASEEESAISSDASRGSSKVATTSNRPSSCDSSVSLLNAEGTDRAGVGAVTVAPVNLSSDPPMTRSVAVTSNPIMHRGANDLQLSNQSAYSHPVRSKRQQPSDVGKRYGKGRMNPSPALLRKLARTLEDEQEERARLIEQEEIARKAELVALRKMNFELYVKLQDAVEDKATTAEKLQTTESKVVDLKAQQGIIEQSASDLQIELSSYKEKSEELLTEKEFLQRELHSKQGELSDTVCQILASVKELERDVAAAESAKATRYLLKEQLDKSSAFLASEKDHRLVLEQQISGITEQRDKMLDIIETHIKSASQQLSEVKNVVTKSRLTEDLNVKLSEGLELMLQIQQSQVSDATVRSDEQSSFYITLKEMSCQIGTLSKELSSRYVQTLSENSKLKNQLNDMGISLEAIPSLGAHIDDLHKAVSQLHQGTTGVRETMKSFEQQLTTQTATGTATCTDISSILTAVSEIKNICAKEDSKLQNFESTHAAYRELQVQCAAIQDAWLKGSVELDSASTRESALRGEVEALQVKQAGLELQIQHLDEETAALERKVAEALNVERERLSNDANIMDTERQRVHELVVSEANRRKDEVELQLHGALKEVNQLKSEIDKLHSNVSVKDSDIARLGEQLAVKGAELEDFVRKDAFQEIDVVQELALKDKTLHECLSNEAAQRARVRDLENAVMRLESLVLGRDQSIITLKNEFSTDLASHSRAAKAEISEQRKLLRAANALVNEKEHLVVQVRREQAQTTMEQQQKHGRQQDDLYGSIAMLENSLKASEQSIQVVREEAEMALKLQEDRYKAELADLRSKYQSSLKTNLDHRSQINEHETDDGFELKSEDEQTENILGAGSDIVIASIENYPESDILRSQQREDTVTDHTIPQVVCTPEVSRHMPCSNTKTRIAKRLMSSGRWQGGLSKDLSEFHDLFSQSDKENRTGGSPSMQKEVTTSVLKTPTAAKVGTGATFLEFNERMNCFTTPILVPSSSILSPLYSDRGVPESTNVTDPANEDRRSDQRDEDRSMLNGPDRAGHITSDEVHNTVLEDVFGNPKAQAYPNTASKIVTARTQSFVARYKQFKQTQANMNPQNMTSGGTDRAPPDVIKVPAKRKLDGVTTKEIRGFSQKSKDTAAEKLSHQEVRRSAKDAKGRAQDRKKARVTQEIGVSQSSKLSRPSSSLVQGLGQQSDKATGKLRSHAGLGGYSTATRRKANQRVIKNDRYNFRFAQALEET